MKAEVLAGLLKRMYDDIDLRNFDDRLKLQKYVYLLQARGIPLGFYFNFYLYGPYSSDLTRTAFQMQEYDSAQKVKFKDSVYESKFNDILSVINTHRDETKWLECASSIIFLKELGYSKRSIYDRIKSKITTFDNEYISEVWDELIGLGWLNGE